MNTGASAERDRSKRSSLPEGIVTFLFADMEGSTKTVGRLGDEAFADLLDTYRTLLRRAFDEHAGRPVQTEDDGYFVAFERPSDAVAAAITAQRALEEHRWPEGARLRARMGVHTGEGVVRGGDYVGPSVHEARRICDAGHGGQVLISATTADLLGRLPDGATLVDLGSHRLKDLDAPMRLHQVAADGLPSNFPPLGTREAAPNNLPVHWATFIGREHETAAVRGLLSENRLVTLTGVGGCGKTRLALQVGERLLDGFGDGAFFVDLSSIADPGLVWRAVAEAAGVRSFGPGAAGSSDETLIEVLADRRCLLLVDNCEHLLDACAELVETVLAACPGVSVLATSREPLAVEGEQVLGVPSLGLPTDEGDVESEAVRLFVDRARSAQPAFEPTPEDVGAVVEIVSRLDGIPLAIEFAAARISHLSPRQISERLDRMFRLLTGGRRRVRRQQTLEATLDWSYELLDERERTLLRRLGVFAGGFTLQSAEAVCSDEHIPPDSVLDLLGSLVGKSLAVADPMGDEVRYRLLETVRAYAEDKLRAASEADTIRSRHRDHYVELVTSFPYEQSYYGTTALGTYAVERDNIGAAVAWSAADGRTDLIGGICARLFGLAFQGDIEDTRRCLEHIELPSGELAPDDQIGCFLAVLYTSSQEVGMQANDDLVREAEEVAPGRTSGPLFQLHALRAAQLGIAYATTNDPGVGERSRMHATESMRIASSLSDDWRGIALTWKAWLDTELGDTPAAAESLAAARGLLDPVQYAPLTVRLEADLCLAQHILGFHDEMSESASAALESADRVESMRPDLGIRGRYAAAVAFAGAGEINHGVHLLLDAVASSARQWVPLLLNEALIAAGAVEVIRARPGRAARLLAAGRLLRGADTRHVPFYSPLGYALYRHYVPLVRASLGPDEARRARDEARQMSTAEAVALALATEATASEEPTGSPRSASAVFTQEAEVWCVGSPDQPVRLNDTKGIRCIAELLARPHTKIHALDLAAAAERTTAGQMAPAEGLTPEADTGPVIDAQARQTYRRRLAEIDDNLREAEMWHDQGRAERLRAERDALAGELSRALGIGGRERRSGSPSERARVNVTRVVKDALQRIEREDPAIGHYLRSTIRTGTYCSYEPPSVGALEWTL